MRPHAIARWPLSLLVAFAFACSEDAGAGDDASATTTGSSTGVATSADSSGAAADDGSSGGAPVDPGLWIDCMGEGEPTIVFEAGLGDAGDIFLILQTDLAADTRVCVYARRGLGASPDLGGYRTTQDWTDDLIALLDFHELTAPVVFVAHSLGGFPIRQLHDVAPERFAGAVLIDTSSATYADYLRDVLPASQLPGFEAYLDGDNPESVKIDDSNAQILALDEDWGDLPLSVISAGELEPFANETPEALQARLDRWQSDQLALAALSTASAYVVAETSKHYVYLEDPDLVLAEIRRVLAQAS